MTCRPLVIVVVVVQGPGGRVLFVERGGLLELPGGKVECGEDPRGAARRELLEETGVGLELGDLRLRGALALKGYGGEDLVALVYSARVEGEPRLRGGCRWVDPLVERGRLAPGTLDMLREAGVGGKDL